MVKYTSVFILLAVIFVCSCKKPTLEGSGLLPKGDNINGIYTDTLTLLTKTVLENSLYTSASNPFMLGSMQDPTFGKSYAGIYCQLSPNTYNPSFSNCVLDSVVLCLVYAGKYGDLKTIPQSVSVYQMTQGLNVDSEYYSNRTFAYSSTKLGEKQNFIPDFTSRPIEDGDTLPPMLRIRLDNSLGESILNPNDSIDLISLANLQSFISGLYIAPNISTPGKGMMYISLASANTRLAVFYHNTATNVTGQQFDFSLNTDCAKANWFSHDYTNTPVATALKSTKTSDSIVYVQAMAGVRTKINIPNLSHLGSILINKAEISITQVFDPTTDDSVFHAPNQMYVLRSNPAGKDSLIPDLLSTAPLSYSGVKSAFINSKGQNVVTYKFSVADQLQAAILNGPNDPNSNSQSLYLISGTSTDLADRLVLGGNKRNDAAKMKLTLVYTKLH